MVPVDGAGVEGERREVSLGHDRLDKVGGDVAGVWEVDAVAAHFGHDVLAEQDDLLGTVIQAMRGHILLIFIHLSISKSINQ